VALTVGVVIMGVALTVTLTTRDGYVSDQNRTRVNQSLRSALDMLGVEIRQAGERLPGDMPAIEIENGDGGMPDKLTLRRNLLAEVLPLCETLGQDTHSDEVRVAFGDDDPPAGCAELPDDDGSGWPDNIDAWREHRDGVGGTAWGYVYNPVQRAGEYFRFDHDNTTSNNFLGKGNSELWSRTYDVDQQCRVYMLEQRHYRLDAGILLFDADDGSAPPVNLSSGVTDLQLRAVLVDGTILDEFDHEDDWTQLRAVEVTLTAEAEAGGRLVRRTVTARFFPRNVLSN